MRIVWETEGASACPIRSSNIPTPAGAVAAPAIVHHGLRDARTLDAYVAMIDTAESHVYTVNGFPSILEIQHSLLR